MKMDQRRRVSGSGLISMLEIGAITRKMDLAYRTMLMETNTKVAGATICVMDKAHFGWLTPRTN